MAVPQHMLPINPELMDTLVKSEVRSRRKMALDALKGFGSETREGVLRYLKDSRWWVIRNMLLLGHGLDKLHEDVDVTEFFGHPDRRVRREAFPLAIRSGSREKTLAYALADDDEYIVRMALLELREAVPEAVVPILITRVVLGERSPEIRALGIRTAGVSRSPSIRPGSARISHPVSRPPISSISPISTTSRSSASTPASTDSTKS